MGSCGSKGSCRGGASSLSGGRKGISIGKNRVFQSSCLGAISGSADSHFDRQVVVVDHHNKDYGSNFTNQNSRERESVSDQVKRECSRKVEAESASDYEMPLPCISSNGVDIDASRSGSSSGRATTALRRANSLGSSRAYPVSPPSLTILNRDDNFETLEHRQLSPNSSSINLYSPLTFNDSDTYRERDRRVGVGSRESVERNRVLRRPSLSNFTLCPLQQSSHVGSQTHAFRGDRDTRQFATSPSKSTSVSGSAHTTTVLSHTPVFNIQGHEHRSNFLERRRRIRSQVSDLLAPVSQLHNLEKPGIMIYSSTTARASLYRIVKLAEALFELISMHFNYVLDEIHQQSVVLSSRASVSSIGSVPAPNEVVELLPVKIYNKSHKLHNDEAGH
uniref:Uncharacterized protein n=1 Tax=Gossypium raimondii TaxID=29730 RepID=A0A0D2SRD1_GOSRA|nr:hypothetical protein B456_007G379500 [Gossypium raimondii]